MSIKIATDNTKTVAPRMRIQHGTLTTDDSTHLRLTPVGGVYDKVEYHWELDMLTIKATDTGDGE